MKIAVGIPARYASTRLPGKPLAPLAGRPMILHVVERALQADVGRVFVATDDARIAAAVEGAGAEVCMTPEACGSGTERLACAVQEIACDIVINLQGDEPLIDPEAIRAVVTPFRNEPDLPMATLAHPLRDEFDFNRSDVVKVVCNAAGHAMYFSRAPIPYMRTESATPLQHVGLYAYRRDFLLRYPDLAPAPTEQAEQLEQLRALHHGHRIAVTVGDFACVGIDTPEDLDRAEAQLNRRPSR
ncbi:MAG TPA: 3-deoxy-manno-octulosonate cytidylyltransferase [Mariprofundaceae bacterium]|nr:3-deoxy-manno-octulosonate cytidylyltransferase [Mariprofundaceae bacterium]